MKRHVQAGTIVAIVTLAALSCAEQAHCANLLPLGIYGVGGTADIWSTRKPPAGYHYRDLSFAGPVVGPTITSLCFGGADVVLQETGHRGWARAVRIFYGLGISAIVYRNKTARPR